MCIPLADSDIMSWDTLHATLHNFALIHLRLGLNLIRCAEDLRICVSVQFGHSNAR